jgi:hypothetical protein
MRCSQVLTCHSGGYSQLVIQTGSAPTTFLLELYLTRVSGTAHGVAAASG